MHKYNYYKIFVVLSQTSYNEFIMNKDYMEEILWHLMELQLQTLFTI